MSFWPSSTAREVLKARRKLGWVDKRTSGSHRVLSRPGDQDYVFAFNEGDEIGPRMLARIGKHTGLTPAHLR